MDIFKLTNNNDNITKLLELYNILQKNRKKFHQDMDDLVIPTSEVTIKRLWPLGPIDKSSIQQCLENVHKNLSGHIRTCGNAIQEINENQIKILNLIKIVFLLEKDLYERLDDHIISNNELNATLSDFFEKQGINNDTVKELLDSNFQRANTLRNRLEENKSSIEKCEKRLQELEDKHLDTEIKRISDELEHLKKKQSEILDKERKKMFVKQKRVMTWTVIVSITLSTALSYIFSHFL